ncbi:MAG: M1 family metallopeptidase [Salibacteraceae bacterium]
MQKLFLVFVAFSMLNSCSIGKKQQGRTPETAIELDTMDFNIDAERLLPYQPSQNLVLDVIHMELDLRFSWRNEEVFGGAELTISPYFEKLDTIFLDARGFEVVAIQWSQNDTSLNAYYSYDGEQMSIVTPFDFNPSDTAWLGIEYIARPTKLEKKQGRAITSNQGLYFINPKGENKEKPQQIWSQGETTYNSSWFPCVDQPNEKLTQEVFITVDSSFHTISNGRLAYSTENADGTRTDYWKQDIPHSTYLVMIAVGEFSLVKDEWKGVPVWYYLDEEYESHAQAIFGNTPEMLTFYSDLLDFKYPWDKYHQIVVKDFVSGAMENTSAVIHGDFVQLTKRELLDESHEDVIAHELFHHWFGNIVTAESWSQITMNEGFATYGEYLWQAYKYGSDEARYSLQKDFESYLNEARMKPKTLIRNRYDMPDDVFDVHSYQKGGLILHMLRNEVGDDVFFKALSEYLHTNAYQAVEDAHFRLALEKVSGKDYKWFFDDWYYQKGHPKVKATYEIDSTKRLLNVSISQTQTNFPLFRFHCDLFVSTNGRVDTHRLWIDQAEERYSISLERLPDWFGLDINHNVLWELDEQKSHSVWLRQLQLAEGYHPKTDALAQLIGLKNVDLDGFEQDLFNLMANHEEEFHAIVYEAIESLFYGHLSDTNTAVELLQTLAMSAPKSDVRSVALFALDSLNYADGLERNLISKAMNDQSYSVIKAALSILLKNDACEGIEFSKQLDAEETKKLMVWISRLHAECASPTSLDFFIKQGKRLNGFERYLFNNDFLKYANKTNTYEGYNALVDQMAPSALDEFSWWARLSAVQALEEAEKFFEKEISRLEEMAETTTDEVEKLAIMRNKKAGISAILEEARELMGNDDQFIR